MNASSCNTSTFVIAAVLAAIACSPTTASRQPTSSTGAITAPALALSQRFSLHEIADRTWVFNEAEPWASNVLLAEMTDGALVLVNAPATEASTRALLDYIDRRFGPRRLVVFNSHHHVDSVGGNAVLIEHGAEVIASTQTAALVASDTPGQVAQMIDDQLVPPPLAPDFAATRLVQPTRTFDANDGLTLRFGDEEVRAIYPGPAHSIDNVVVHFPTRGVVFGGCMVRAADALGPTDHADVAHWPAAIATLQALQPTHVVPGHVARFDADQLQNTLDLLAAFMRAHPAQ